MPLGLWKMKQNTVCISNDNLRPTWWQELQLLEEVGHSALRMCPTSERTRSGLEPWNPGKWYIFMKRKMPVKTKRREFNHSRTPVFFCLRPPSWSATLLNDGIAQRREAHERRLQCWKHTTTSLVGLMVSICTCPKGLLQIAAKRNSWSFVSQISYSE